MKAYSLYKNSNLQWWQEVPNHWAVMSLRHSLEILTDYAANGSFEDLRNNVTYIDEPNYSRLVRLTDLRVNFENDGVYVNKHSHEFLKKSELFGGEILIANIGAYAGFVCQMPKLGTNATLGPNMYILKFDNTRLNNEYAFYLLISAPCQKQLQLKATSTAQPKLNKDDVKSLFISVPPISEQQAIADFLDRKTAQIDTLIEKKQRQIDLLQEEHKALINHAVTKGLNPDVRMKDSGVEWLGEIPSHWEVRKVSRSFNLIGSGTTPQSDNTEYYENGTIPWVLTGDLNNGLLTTTSKKITQLAFDNHSALKLYPAGTLLVAMYGATIGKISIMEIEGCTNQACCALSNSPYINTKFAFYWFLANKQHVISLGYGGGQPNISQDVIRSLKISTPPLVEQQTIVDFLDSKTIRFDELTEKFEGQIMLYQEYRTALISEAVTGKIDVRTAV